MADCCAEVPAVDGDGGDGSGGSDGAGLLAGTPGLRRKPAGLI